MEQNRNGEIRKSEPIMSPTDKGRAPAATFRGAVREKCFICGAPVGEQCFCKIYRKQAEPVVLCCPSCTAQYLESARTPADAREAELLQYEKSVHWFIGEEKLSP